MPTTKEGWIRLAAGVLEHAEAELAVQAATASFAMLGGTSLRAVELAAAMARDHGRAVDLAELLGTRPLAAVLGEAPAAPPRTAAPQPAAGLRPLSRLQEAILFGEQLHGGSAFHLLFSADITGPVDRGRLRAALTRITRRHAELRTVFVRRPDGSQWRRVLERWEPFFVEQAMPPMDGDLVTAVHRVLQPAGGVLLDPFLRPPVAFVLSRFGSGRSVLSLLAHHALVDGWGIGLLWRELAEAYASAEGGDLAPAPSMEAPAEASPQVLRAVRERADALRGLPATVSLPSDLERPARQVRTGTRLVFGLGDEARLGCEALAGRAGLTRNMVLLAAWALVVARRTAMDELVMGMVSAGRTDEESLRAVGAYVKQLPVACSIPGSGSVLDYLRSTAVAIREALAAGQVPFEDLVTALGLGGDGSRNPLVQVAFAAHDELVPDVLRAGDLTLRLTEGHCGQTVYDAVLYVQKWAGRPRLALEYATSVLRPDEAAELATALGRTLTEMGAAPDGPITDVRTMTAEQRERLESWGEGPPADAGAGLWELFEAAARRDLQAVAVRDGDPARELTYGRLLLAAEAQSAALAAAGVRAGDCVALAVRRSAAEIVAVLAILRLGASYTAIEADVPAPLVRTMLRSAGARLLLGEEAGIAALPGHPALRLLDPWDVRPGPVPPAAAPDPSAVAYVAFTSGSTGTPKGTRVPHRGVVRLARDPAFLLPGAGERFVRLAPLAFDASTLEIFAPLLSGGTIEVYPAGHVTPDDLAAFLHVRRVTALWLTAGLFRLVADYRPDAFGRLRQLLTGGDVVPPSQVAQVLDACPGLRITNGYGPTENTTFTTVHHVDGPAEAEEPLPIGRPVQGTGVLVLDAAGGLVPPGGVGELHTYGAGVALGYAGLPEETARAFWSRAGRLLYRTGDLVRWDGAGRLRFLGRADRQVKIRGFRIELDAVTRVLREHPAVRDVAVVAAGSGADRRLLAGIVATAPGTDGRLPGVMAGPEADRRLTAGVVAEKESLAGSLRSFAIDRLPGYAVPALWAVVEELPLTRNGKLDTAALTAVALTGGRTGPPDPDTAARDHGQEGAEANRDEGAEAGREAGGAGVEEIISGVWREVLGTDRIGLDQRFFEAGGDSLQLLRVAATLRRELPSHEITIQDLYAYPTIRTLRDRLEAEHV